MPNNRKEEDHPQKDRDLKAPMPLEEGKDYYLENGLFVLTEDFLIRRGYCCQSGCRHCPYGFPGRSRTGKEDAE
jgi:hypothetical protein